MGDRTVGLLAVAFLVLSLGCAFAGAVAGKRTVARREGRIRTLSGFLVGAHLALVSFMQERVGRQRRLRPGGATDATYRLGTLDVHCSGAPQRSSARAIDNGAPRVRTRRRSSDLRTSRLWNESGSSPSRSRDGSIEAREALQTTEQFCRDLDALFGEKLGQDHPGLGGLASVLREQQRRMPAAPIAAPQAAAAQPATPPSA